MLLVETRRGALLPAPYGAGGSSGNLKIGQSAGTNRVVYRLVPKIAGTLWDIWVETRARTGPACSPQLADADSAESSSYSGGNPNNWLWEVRFHPVNADGTFDPATNLVPARQFNPYFQRRNTSQEVSGYPYAGLKIPVGDTGLAVTAGTPIAMTVAPANSAPATDYASVNELYITDGLEGAQGRNELLAAARDVHYGLDPREGMGGSNADGSSQWYPGNNFNTAPFTKHLPTYLMVYQDGKRHGQPYFSAAFSSAPINAGTEYVMTYTAPKAMVVTHLGAVFITADSFPATIAVNGTDRATVTLSCSVAVNPNRIVRVPLPTQLTLAQGDVVTVRFTTTVTNAVVRCYASSVFAALMNHGTSFEAYLVGDPTRVVPIYPLPWPYPRVFAGTAPHGAPSIPSSFTATGGAGQNTLGWTASPETYTDHYVIYRDGTLLATTTTAGYVDSAVTTGQSYSYQVSAVGTDGRESAKTSGQSATSSAAPNPPVYGSRIASAVATSALSSWTVTLTADTQIGDLLALMAGGRNSGAVMTGVTDSKGNTWAVTAQKQDSGSNNTVAVATCRVATRLLTGDTITVTFGAAVGPSRLTTVERVTNPTSTPVDKTATNSGSSGTSKSTGTTPATTQAQELAVAAILTGSGASTFTDGGGGYTVLAKVSSSGAANGDRSMVTAYKTLNATGTQECHLTDSQSGIGYAGAIFTLKGAAP